MRPENRTCDCDGPPEVTDLAQTPPWVGTKTIVMRVLVVSCDHLEDKDEDVGGESVCGFETVSIPGE